MRKKLMKTKVMAMAMAAALGVAGAVATAQAATAEEGGCAHEDCVFLGSETFADFYDRQQHIWFYNEYYHCLNCDQDFDIRQILRYEDHDYEQIYYEDGTGLTYCPTCGDSYPF